MTYSAVTLSCHLILHCCCDYLLSSLPRVLLVISRVFKRGIKHMHNSIVTREPSFDAVQVETLLHPSEEVATV